MAQPIPTPDHPFGDYVRGIEAALRTRDPTGPMVRIAGSSYTAAEAIHADGYSLHEVTAAIAAVPSGRRINLAGLHRDLRRRRPRMTNKATGPAPATAWRWDPPGWRPDAEHAAARREFPLPDRDAQGWQQVRDELSTQTSAERQARMDRLRQWIAEIRHVLVDSPGCAPRGPDERLDRARLRASGSLDPHDADRMTQHGPEGSRVCRTCGEIVWHPALRLHHPARGVVKRFPKAGRRGRTS